MNRTLRASIRTAARIAALVPRGQSFVSGLEVYFSQVQGIGYVASMEEESRAAFQCIHSSAPIVFDVGANEGDWTRSLLQLVSPDAHIYAFDPSATNVDKLRQIADSRVTVVPTALGNFEGQAPLYTPFPGSGMGSLLNFRPTSTHDVAALDQETVQVTSLDSFVKKQGISSIEFMKMDLEGSEYAALEGGIETLRAGIVQALSFEFGQCNIASRTYLLDFWYLLNELSFTLNLIGPNGVLIPIRDYSPRYEVLRHSNFIAIRDPRGVRPTQYHR